MLLVFCCSGFLLLIAVQLLLMVMTTLSHVLLLSMSMDVTMGLALIDISRLHPVYNVANTSTGSVLLRSACDVFLSHTMSPETTLTSLLV
jgi:hypothetical protein